MYKFKEEAEQKVQVIKNSDYTITEETCMGASCNISFEPRTLTNGRNPCFVYDKETSILLALDPYSNFMHCYAFTYARREYGFTCELDYYNKLVEGSDDLPWIEEILINVKCIVAKQLCFNAYLESKCIDQLNGLFIQAYYENNNAKRECYKSDVRRIVDRFYEEHPLFLL
jgi:hypothetical protein